MRPIVAVIGTTGVGKSQLAVSLAQSLDRTKFPTTAGDGDTVTPFNQSKGSLSKRHNDSSTNDGYSPATAGYTKGTVLSADSMQLYKGLDVITNKVTKAEMGGVEHWGLDMVQPGEGGSWELGKWCTEAGKVVDDLPKTTLPIICGGTHYFIQHFLFPPPELSMDRDRDRGQEAEVEGGKGKSPARSSSNRWFPPHPHPPTPNLDPGLERLLDTFWTPKPIWPGEAELEGDTLPLQEIAGSSSNPNFSGAATWTDSQLLSLHRLLAAVDPAEAGRWHWRDGRKVKRGLERWWERGGAIADTQQAEKQGASSVPRRAKFRTLIFWVYEPMETLRPRLDRRVDNMVANGLLREIAELRGIATNLYGSPETTDHTEGIFQAIGYKEFSQLPLDISDPTAHPSFPAMLDRMKMSTHQYAKSQLKWIRNQLLPAVREAQAKIGEDGDGDVWVYVVPGGQANENLTQQILNDFLAGKPLPDPLSLGHGDAAELLRSLDTNDSSSTVPDIAGRQQVNARRDCDICSTPEIPVSIMLKDWEMHTRSKSHKRNVVAANGGNEALIEQRKLAGLAKKAERERLRDLKLAAQSDATT